MGSQVALLPGYAEELAGAESDIQKLEERRHANPRDLEKRVRLAYRLFHRASLTASIDHFAQVEICVRECLADFGPREDICLLRANLAFRFHRLRGVYEALAMCPVLSERFEGRVLVADLDFQEGRYLEARLRLEELVKEDRTWDNIARLAHWHGKLGDVGEADRLYAEAEDELTAKQMRSYAWLQLQRGILAITHGCYEDAWRHYQRAEDSYPGHWHTDEHFAELLAAEGRYEEAARLFLDVIARTQKPELQQALGELYAFTGREDEAQAWFDSALRTYLASAERGEVHYYHHLADFYADAREVPAEAVKWARRDVEMRSNFSTQAALAWALFRNGELAKAADWIRQSLASGVRDAGIYSIASTLLEASGDTAESAHYRELSLSLNPRHGAFHMHH
jgi:tetratricopeptide (TPR) repeat protein